jgi:hypothetical protein
MVPAWVRFGLVAGVVAFAATLTANLSVLILQPADLCRIGPGILPLSFLAAFAAFVVLAALAGFMTGRATGAVSQAALTGLLVATISGCALVAMIPFVPSLRDRVDVLTARCPGTSSFTSTRSFSFSLPTPPPGFVPPTPPPGFFATPPAGLGSPPAGAVGIILELLGVVVPIGTGMALATGVASLSGLVGAATRSEPS